MKGEVVVLYDDCRGDGDDDVRLKMEMVAGTFTPQARNRLFTIQEQVVKEYVMEFLSSFAFREHIVDLDNDDTMVFQLGGIRRSMTIRHSGKEKITLDDLFLLHSMDGGARVDVPWHVAKFFIDKGKGYKKKSLIVGAHFIRKIARLYGLMIQRSLKSVTLGLETSLLSVAKLVDLGICRYNGLSLGEMVDDLSNDGRNEAGEAGEEQENVEGVRRHPNMTFSNKLRAIDEVQQGVNFMSNTPVYSTDPYSSPNPFGLFGDANAGTSTSQYQGNDMDED
nr:hypothetical protein [Tanacetum cinerariifolium]